MDWINFQKIPPTAKGLCICALSEINQKGFSYCIAQWDGKVFVDMGGNISYPYSVIMGGVLVTSATVVWYYYLLNPPSA